MAKKNFGLDKLISPTEEAPTSKEKVTPTLKATSLSGKNGGNKKEEIINSNIPLTADHHWQLRMIALQRKTSLRVLMQEIVSDYLERNAL